MNLFQIDKKCLWCLEKEPKVTFVKKAHTIPKSLGGQNYNKNVCDGCNYYFGNRDSHNGKYSIEVALKEAFSISRKRFLMSGVRKRKVGEFKSQFFEIKERNGKFRLAVKPSFIFTSQTELCRAFKRGLLKMFFEEFNRQKNKGFEDDYNNLREYCRYNKYDVPVVYFKRRVGIFLMFKREAETPILYFDRMNYLYSDKNFIEVEFLGHVFGIPLKYISKEDFENYIHKSLDIKKQFFSEGIIIEKITDIDISLSIIDQKL